MAWMTNEEGRMYSRLSQEPDIGTLMYWITRLDPVIRKESEDEIIVVLANRTGTEENAMYTGTSAVVGIKGGEVRLYGVLGRGEKDLLIVDTELAPFAKLVQRPDGPFVEPYKATPLAAKPAAKPAPYESQSSPYTMDQFKEMAKPQKSPKKVEPEVSPQRSSKSRQSRLTKSKTGQKLVIDTSPSTIYAESAEAGNIRTPNYPSPTPHSIRPRLTIPPTESLTAKYVEEQLHHQQQGSYLEPLDQPRRNPQPDTPHPLFSPLTRPIQILGGDVTIMKEPSTPFTSPVVASRGPVMNSLSHFSDASPSEPRLFWAAPNPNGDFGRWWHDRDLTTTTAPGGKSDGTNFSENGSWISGNISPVVTHRGYPIPKTPTAQLNPPSLPPGLPTFTKFEAVNPPETIDEAPEQRADEEGFGRPASPKSRNASRSRGPERPGSAIDPSVDLGRITKKLDEIAQRVGSANGWNTPTQGYQFAQAPPAYKEVATKAEVEELKALNITQPSNSMRRYGRFWDDPEDNRPGSLPKGLEERKKPEDNFLASSFQSKSRARSNSDRGRAAERPGSRASLRPQQLSNINHSRTVSRGRQPYPSQENTTSRNTPSGTTPSRAGQQSTERSSNKSRPSPSVEPVDLSQFVLIEEFPSMDCPMHGSRPGSKARNHGSNDDRRMQSTGPPRGSPPSRRAQTSDPYASAVQLPLRPVGYPLPSSSEIIVTEVGAPPEASSTGSPSPSSPREPRTPKALALIYDGDNASIPELSLKCIERTSAIHLSRPKSAIL